MANITLKDTTTLELLFNEANAWENMPISSLSEEQVALIQLKRAIHNKSVASKNGGAAYACFICWTAA